jgi:hypothetical protein
VTLVLAALGAAHRIGRAARRWPALARPSSASEDVFLLLCALAFYAPWLSSATPIFGGTKHWLPAYPFLALFAGAAFARALAAARSLLSAPLVRAVLPSLAATAVLAAPLAESLHALPFGLGAYVPLVGGAPGGASLGLQRGFWGYAATRAAPFLDRAVRPGGHVYLHDVLPESFRLLARDGRLRADLVGVATLDDADAALYQDEPHMRGQEFKIWDSFGTAAPSEIDGLDGVPMLLVYQRAGNSPSGIGPSPSGVGSPPSKPPE